jgi:hypothetical protein
LTNRKLKLSFQQQKQDGLYVLNEKPATINLPNGDFTSADYRLLEPEIEIRLSN